MRDFFGLRDFPFSTSRIGGGHAICGLLALLLLLAKEEAKG